MNDEKVPAKVFALVPSVQVYKKSSMLSKEGIYVKGGKSSVHFLNETIIIFLEPQANSTAVIPMHYKGVLFIYSFIIDRLVLLLLFSLKTTSTFFGLSKMGYWVTPNQFHSG